MRYAYKISVRKPEREKPLLWTNNGSTDYKAVGCDNGDWVVWLRLLRSSDRLL
jgi:hypothetical protein